RPGRGILRPNIDKIAAVRPAEKLQFEFVFQRVREDRFHRQQRGFAESTRGPWPTLIFKPGKGPASPLVKNRSRPEESSPMFDCGPSRRFLMSAVRSLTGEYEGFGSQ